MSPRTLSSPTIRRGLAESRRSSMVSLPGNLRFGGGLRAVVAGAADSTRSSPSPWCGIQPRPCSRSPWCGDELGISPRVRVFAGCSGGCSVGTDREPAATCRRRSFVAITHGQRGWLGVVSGTAEALRAIGDRVDTVTYLGEYTRTRISGALSPAAADRMRRLVPGVDHELSRRPTARRVRSSGSGGVSDARGGLCPG